MHVAQNFLIRADHKEAQHWRVLWVIFRHRHSGGNPVAVHVMIDSPVGITGDIQQHRTTFRRVIQPFQRQNREQLIDTPGVRHRLEQREVDVHLVRHTLLQLVDNRTVRAVARVELFLHFMAHVQIQLLGPGTLLQAVCTG
ncbi:hypothetical protein D3C76_1497650 [compost metagenome]